MRLKQALIGLVLSAAICPVLADEQQIEFDSPDAYAVGVDAVVLHSVAPVYPPNALKQGYEGWVDATFVVISDGTTDHIQIVDSSIEGIFDNAVIEAIENSTYSPATLNGIAISQAKHSRRHTFYLAGSAYIGVRKNFEEVYGPIVQALEENELDTAWELIQELESKKLRSMLESCYFDILNAKYLVKKGDTSSAIKFARRATGTLKLYFSDDFADTTNAGRFRKSDKYAELKNLYSEMLQQLFILNAKHKNYVTALTNYEELTDLIESAPDATLQNLAENITNLLAGGRPIFRNGKIEEPCSMCRSLIPSWWRALNRNQFTIDNVAGNVSEFTLYCGFHYATFEYIPEKIWETKQEWGKCDIQVFGKEGTTLELVEFANLNN